MRVFLLEIQLVSYIYEHFLAFEHKGYESIFMTNLALKLVVL